MALPTDPDAGTDVPSDALLPFLLIAFGLAWGILGLFIYFNTRMVALFGPLSGRDPLFVLAVYAPAIAALVLVILHGGLAGLGRFLTRLTLWRCPIPWALFLLLGIPLLFLGGALVKGNLTRESFVFPDLGPTMGALGLTLIIGPVEEFGWRGLALPILQRHFAPLWAGLILGLIWGLWHLPAFFLSGTPQSAWSFTPFFVASVAVSVILTPFFNASGGSILLAALFHFQLNNPLWPDAQPWDTAFFAVAALVVVWLNRGTMFHRNAAVTRVIPARPTSSRATTPR